MSWPVGGSLMVEPTESEPKKELDRFIRSMRSINDEIQYIINNNIDQDRNVLKNAPHNAKKLISTEWNEN